MNSRAANPTEDEILEAIAQGLGIKTTIARKLGCGRSTLDKWINERPTIAAAYAEAHELLLDAAEDSLVKQMLAGDMKAIRYLLDTKGQSRGYGRARKVEVDHTHRMGAEERAARFARVARAFGHELPADGIAGVIDVTATAEPTGPVTRGGPEPKR